MLSRVVERLYWMARYLERAENTARLINCYNNLIMDIPLGSEPSWTLLVDILDAKDDFQKHYAKQNERNVHKFLTGKASVPCSIPFGIEAARENVRTTRDVLPEEAWEQINELHLFATANANAYSSRRTRLLFLENVIKHCQAISGLLETTQSRDHAYRFIKLGRLIERADMTARTVDVGAGDILDREGINASIDPILWGALLEAVSGKSAYRRTVGPIVDKEAIVEFLFNAEDFPRSVMFCLTEMRRELGSLPNRDETITSVDRIRRKLRRANPSRKSRPELHKFIDSLQLGLIQVNNDFKLHWFHRGEP